MADDIVRCSLATAFLVRNRAVAVVAVIRVGVLQNDVPGVQEAGQEAQTAERDVDEGVSGAETAFYPDSDGWEEDAEEHQEAVGAAHGCSAAELE